MAKLSSRKANAIGYSKRQSRVSKSKTGLSDVYEFQPEKIRRSRTKVALALSRDEAAELGRSDHSEAEEEDALKGARLIGENKDDEVIDSDDDEDIDSDGAFGESDEETFAGYGFLQKSKPKKKQPTVRFADVDLNEDESAAEESDGEVDSDEEEEGEPDEFVDVLDILDGRAEADPGSDEDLAQGQNSGSEDEEVDSEEASEEEQERISDEDPEALDHLDDFISNLETAKRKAPGDDDIPPSEAVRSKKRKLLKERTEAGIESEFAAAGSGKLNLEDLLAPLANQSSSLVSLKKSTKVLTSSKGKVLAAPLPQRTQERLDREAAYEQTKEEVDKWHATMKRIKEADHLSFPLQAQPASQPTSLELVAKFKPTTALETSVDKLLAQANMLDSDIQKTEALKMNHLTVEEVTARRAELRKMRDLMFRAEIKAKRLSKIKSKTYRRLKKKEKQKLAEKLGEDEDDDEDEEGRLKREVMRARERATLKHKNTGKWAKAMKVRGELDEEQRMGVLEMLERGEKLRKKIRGGGGSDEDESSDEEDANPDQIRAAAFEEVSRLHADDDTPEYESKKGKGVFEMKFMKDAMARDKQKTAEMAVDFLKELGGSDQEADDDEEIQAEATGITIQRTGGRVTYRPGDSGLLPQLRSMGSLASDTSSVTLRSTDFPPDSPMAPPRTLPSIKEVTPTSPTSSNPWLTTSNATSNKAPRKKNEIVVNKNSGTADKSKNRLRKRQNMVEDEKAKAKEDAAVDVSMTEVMNLDAPPQKKAAKGDDDDSDVNSEVEEQESALERRKAGNSNGRSVKAFQQRDLVALAFAGDKVVQDFHEAKEREINEDAPQEVDTTLPGWGSWGGSGTKKAPPKPHFIKKIAGVDPKSREDYGKAHVIISEKRDKKAAKYMMKDLPYPYTSRAQFERSMNAPIGTEWNTRVGFQRSTLPRVVKKPGVVIEPLEKQHS